MNVPTNYKISEGCASIGLGIFLCEKDPKKENPVPAQAKAGKQPASKANKKCAAAEEVPLDIVTPKKKKRKSKKSKTEATEKILDVIEFDEAQKTTVTDETCKDLKLIVQMT